MFKRFIDGSKKSDNNIRAKVKQELKKIELQIQEYQKRIKKLKKKIQEMIKTGNRDTAKRLLLRRKKYQKRIQSLLNMKKTLEQSIEALENQENVASMMEINTDVLRSTETSSIDDLEVNDAISQIEEASEIFSNGFVDEEEEDLFELDKELNELESELSLEQGEHQSLPTQASEQERDKEQELKHPDENSAQHIEEELKRLKQELELDDSSSSIEEAAVKHKHPSVPSLVDDTTQQGSSAKYKTEEKGRASNLSQSTSDKEVKQQQDEFQTTEQGYQAKAEETTLIKKIYTGISYYDRIIPMENFPLKITLSHSPIKKKGKKHNLLTGTRKTQHREEVGFKEDFVEVKPIYPGCLVSPPSRTADLRQKRQELDFSITALVKGDIDGGIEFCSTKSKTILHSIDLPITSQPKTYARIVALVGTMIGVIPSLFNYLFGVDINSIVKTRLSENFSLLFALLPSLNSFDWLLMLEIVVFVLCLIAAVGITYKLRPNHTENFDTLKPV